MKNRKQKRIIFSAIMLFMVVVMLISYNTFVKAKASKYIVISRNELESDSNYSLYCRQWGPSLSFDKTNVFTIKDKDKKVKIDVNDEEAIKVGHVFYNGEGYKKNGSFTDTQRWAWKNGNLVGRVFDMNFVPSGSGQSTYNQEFSNKVNEFAAKNKAKATTGEGSVTRNDYSENYKIGPFSVEYTEKIQGTEAGSAWVESIEVYDVDGKQVDNKSITILDENGKEIKTRKETFEDKKERTIIDLKSNQKFYVINNSEYEVKKVKVKIKKLAVKYQFDVTVYDGQGLTDLDETTVVEWDGVEDGELKLDGETQDLFYEGNPIVEYVETEDVVEFEVNVKKGTLKLEKIGEYEKDGQKHTENLQGIKFKVYCEAPINKWVKSNSKEKIEWTENINEAKEFKTKEDGTLSIKYLYASQDANKNEKYIYEYRLVECANSENSAYLDPIVISNARSDEDGNITVDVDESVDLKMSTGEKAKYGIKGVTVFYSKDNKIIITDELTSKDITIEKIDSEFKNGLKNVEFKIKLKQAKYYTGFPYERKANLWLKNMSKENENGTYDFTKLSNEEYFTDKEEEAGIFKTNSEGKINLLGITDGEYEVYETKSIAMYDLEFQKDYSEKDQYRICKNVSDKTDTYIIENEKTRGNLELAKLLQNKKIGASGVEFEIYVEDKISGKKYWLGLPIKSNQVSTNNNNNNKMASKNTKDEFDSGMEYDENGNLKNTQDEFDSGMEYDENGNLKNTQDEFDSGMGYYDYRELKYNEILKYEKEPGENAKFYVDNATGKLQLLGVPLGTYHIYETRTHNIEYALEGQGTFDEQNKRTEIAVIEVTKQQDDTKVNDGKEVNIEQKERPQGDLEIYKRGHYANNGEEVYEPLKNVSFILSSTAVDKGGLKTAEQKYVFINKNESNEEIIDFTTDKEKATRFKTGEDGKVIIKNLYIDLGPYTVEEEANENEYYNDRIVIGGSLKNNTFYDGKIIEPDLKAGEKTQLEIIDERSSGDLNLIKVDSIYNTENKKDELKLKGAEFKIELVNAQYFENVTNMWLKAVDGYNYSKIEHSEYLVPDVNQAGTFVSDENGEIHIKRIINGTYRIWETKAPEGYSLEKQKGYDEQTKRVLIDTIEIKTLNNNTVNMKIENQKTVVQLEGNVWKDIPGTKLNNYNEIQDENEEKISGITVELYDKQKGKVIATTTTDENGHYEFTYKNVEGYEKPNLTNTYNSLETDPRINYWELANCYVRFIYDNIGKHDENGFIVDDQYGYVTVDPFVGDNVKINSKAKEYTINQEKLEEENLTGLEGKNPGIAVTKPGPNNIDEYVEFTSYDKIREHQSLKDEDKLLPGYYNDSDYTIRDINLGLKDKPITDFTITEDIAYMKVRFGQYTYKYAYASEEQQIKETVPTVNEQVSSKKFTGKIYPSDIAYNKDNNTDELKVYVIYRIAIQNSTTNNISNSYVEDKMYLSSLVDKYDTARFELSDDISDVDIEEVKRDVKLWSKDESNTVKYDVDNQSSSYYDGIGPLETKTSYVQYRLNEESVQKILQKKLTAEDINEAPSQATAKTFHEFFRNDNLWQQSQEKQYKDHKQQNYDSKGEYLHKSWHQNRTTSELYMRFDLPAEERQITGTIFEDTPINTNELGNGRKEDTEKTVAPVFVELISNLSDNQAAKIYPYEEIEKGTLGVAAKTTVDVDGTYTFKGVIPGYYYLRFTYGNGDVKYKDLSGNEITEKIESKIDGQNITTNNYKSTIITSNAVKNAIENQKTSNDQELEWYKKMLREEADNYSTAVDTEAQRLNNSAQTYQENNTPIPEPIIDAYTPKMSITIENSDENFANNSDVEEGRKNGKYYNYNGFNFGIITMPKTIMKLDKKIVNVDYTLTSGEQLVSANPSKNSSLYLTALDNLQSGSRYAKVELDPNLMYGSQIDVTYEVEVKNDSTPFFTNWEYSLYGEENESEPAKVKVTVKDILDEKYDYDKVKLASDKVTNNKGETTDKATPVTITTKNENSIKYEEIENWEELGTGEKETITYTASALLQAGEDNPAFTNQATIDTMKLDKYTSLNTAAQIKNEEGLFVGPWDVSLVAEDTTFVVTPSTGEDRSNTYWIAGAIALIVLGAGIVVIKKRLAK